MVNEIETTWDDISNDFIYSDLLGIEPKYQFILDNIENIFNDENNFHIHYVMPKLIWLSEKVDMNGLPSNIFKNIILYYLNKKKIDLTDVMFCNIDVFKK